MKFIGITGGVGAGKTEILNYLKQQEAVKVMLADEIAHQLMLPNTLCHEKLKELFAKDDVWMEDGSIHPSKMAAVIFKDETKRVAMNNIVHPAVKAYVKEIYEKEQKEGKLRLLILEAALLIEDGYDKICDELWYIYTTKENRRKRLKESRGYSDEKIYQMFASQLSEEIYHKYCKVIIDNNGSKENTLKQVEECINRREYKS